MKRIVGPKLRSRLSHHGRLPASGLALTTTAFVWSRSESEVVSAKAGISVWNSVEAFEPA